MTVIAASFSGKHCAKVCKNLFLDELTSDVSFVFVSSGDKLQYLPAHKFLLVNGSTVFKELFSGAFEEVDEVAVVGANHDEFKEFLQIFYLGQITLSVGNVAGVMMLAHKYNVTECLDLCETFLLEYMPVERICSAFDLAITYDRKQLKEHCQRVISENSVEAFASDSFRKCSHEVLKQILVRGDFSCSAKELFDACMAWAGQMCVKKELDASKTENRVKQLGECLYLMPFHLMNHKEVNECIAELNMLLTQTELLEIISMITTGASCLGNLVKFKPTPTFKTIEKLSAKTNNDISKLLAAKQPIVAPSAPSHVRVLNGQLSSSSLAVSPAQVVQSKAAISTQPAAPTKQCFVTLKSTRLVTAPGEPVNRIVVKRSVVKPTDAAPDKKFKVQEEWKIVN